MAMILVACEYSGRVRDALIDNGHNAWSCDLLPTEGRNCFQHFQKDVADILDYGWDAVIAFPPCDHLAVSGARWFPEKRADGRQQAAVKFFMLFVEWHRKYGRPLAIENPVGIMSSEYRKPDQYIQPWQFGHGETKKTGLWLHGLPPLKPTEVVDGREGKMWRMPPGPERKKKRSLTYAGIAAAMGSQWGDAIHAL